MDWDKFRNKLEANLRPNPRIDKMDTIEAAIRNPEEVIKNAIQRPSLTSI